MSAPVQSGVSYKTASGDTDEKHNVLNQTPGGMHTFF